MPTFENVDIEITQKIDIEFEVYCGTCGAGLCSEADTRKSRNRNYLQVTVNCCPDCLKEKQREIDNINSEFIKLEDKIYELEQELEKQREFYNA